MGEPYLKFRNDQGFPLIRISVRKFACIGASPPEDHPHLYLEMPENADEILCPYCATRFRFDPALPPAAADPPVCAYIEIGPEPP